VNRPPIDRINWRGAGYYAFPLARTGANTEEVALWADFEQILEKAKRGNFDDMPKLVDLYDTTDSWILSEAYITLLGDAGTRAAIDRVLPVVRARVEPTYQVDLSRALTVWGELSVVPPILTGWQDLEGFQDAEDIPPALSEMLEEAPGPIVEAADHARKDEYVAIVLTGFEELKAAFGTEKVFLLRGGMVSVRRLAGLMLAELAVGQLDLHLRRRFEALTGIDCTSFHQDESLRPLAATAVVEEFLESPEASRYEDGVRYFFGHRIPD
jgi:hypothetical protein